MIDTIITDLDRTLLRDAGYISEYTVSVLQACRAKGFKVVFATARSIRASRRFLSRFTPDVFIGYGGALIMSGDTVINRCGIPADISHRLLEDCLNTPEVSAVFAINESVAFSSIPPGEDGADFSHYKYSGFERDDGHSYLKISVNAAEPCAVERIAARYPLCDMLRYTGEDLYRFAHRDAIKWRAVKAMAEYYGWDTHNFAAFGDDVNDVEMIENCGTGVAVANAVDAVKAAARHVCGSNEEDGVARWIQEHVL